MVEGLANSETQLVHPFTAQLRAFQQRLLRVDARNPSVSTRKIVKKRNFDLCDHDAKKAEKAFAHVIAGGGRQRLLGDSTTDKESMGRRELQINQALLGSYWRAAAGSSSASGAATGGGIPRQRWRWRWSGSLGGWQR